MIGWHAQVRWWHLIDLIPFWLQSRESLGFLTSVNLGFDTRTTLRLGFVGRRPIRHHKYPPV